MNEIERLTRAIGEYNSLIDIHKKSVEECINQIAELKKADEVKPVFPDDGIDCSWLHIDSMKTAHNYGLTAETDEELTEIESRLEARKHIIEAINVANKGDNGFNEERLLLVWNHDENELGFIGERQRQHCEQGMYINSSLDANSLAFRKDIIDACKILFGIK